MLRARKAAIALTRYVRAGGHLFVAMRMFCVAAPVQSFPCRARSFQHCRAGLTGYRRGCALLTQRGEIIPRFVAPCEAQQSLSYNE